jgi:hypothetical protein
MSTRRLHPLSVMLVVAAALALAGCPDEVERPPEEEPPPEAPLEEPPEEPVADLTAECTNPDGFASSYPGDWVTNEEQINELPPCSLFDPESVELDETLHVPEDIAVFIRIQPPGADRGRPRRPSKRSSRPSTRRSTRCASLRRRRIELCVR